MMKIDYSDGGHDPYSTWPWRWGSSSKPNASLQNFVVPAASQPWLSDTFDAAETSTSGAGIPRCTIPLERFPLRPPISPAVLHPAATTTGVLPACQRAPPSPTPTPASIDVTHRVHLPTYSFGSPPLGRPDVVLLPVEDSSSLAWPDFEPDLT